MINTNKLIKSLLEESTITRNQVLTAIKKSMTLQVEKSIMNGEKTGTQVLEIVPIDIDKDNLVTGTTKGGDNITFDLNSITTDLSQLKEEVKIKKDSSGNATITGLEDADEKTAAAALSSVPPGKEITIDESKDVDKRSGLIVVGKTQTDNTKIGEVMNSSGFYAEWDSIESYWFFPEEEELYDSVCP